MIVAIVVTIVGGPCQQQFWGTEYGILNFRRKLQSVQIDMESLSTVFSNFY